MSAEQGAPAALLEQIARAECLLKERELEAALAEFDRAERMGADVDGCSAARWMAWMLRGDFAAAWRESDAIRARGGEDPHRFWMGEDLRGQRVIVRCLHGFGDAVQFLRYLPQIQAMARHVIVEVPPRMLEWAPMLDGVDDVVTWGADAPQIAPAWDVQVEVMELPYVFRTTTEDLPIAVKYVRPPARDLERMAKEMGAPNRTRVGLVWSGGEWNPQRSLPTEAIQSLVESGSAEFWSLQGEALDSRALEWVHAGALRDAAQLGDGLRALAMVIGNLDLVITVDTLAAHLAGAMGKPAWVLLQRSADWRWMTNRCDSPWYPKTRLFRQQHDGSWNGVVEEVAEALKHLVGCVGARAEMRE